MADLPVVVVIDDDLRRSRLTVFFRGIIAIPYFLWLEYWTIAVLITWPVQWLVTLIRGRPINGLHMFFSHWIRYRAHLTAFLTFAANPLPGFNGTKGSYPIDVTLPEPARQNRWKTLFRPFLALLTLPFYYVGFAIAILGWFVGLFTGRVRNGLRDLGAYATGYRSAVRAYGWFVTDRFPSADPAIVMAGAERPALHPVRLGEDHENYRRSRVIAFFRIPLLVPHLVWLELWGVLALGVVVLQWIVTLLRGRPVHAFHRFLSRFVRQTFTVYAFATFVGNPFPGFTGRRGSYPLDLALPPPARQNRWKTLFRLLLVLPAALLLYTLMYLVFFCAVLSWFVAVFAGRSPHGLRNFSAYVLRYSAQLNAYLYLLTDVYPHSSPLEGCEPAPEPFALDEAAPVPA